MFKRNKKLSAFILAGAMMFSVAFTGCSALNTADIKNDPAKSIEDAMMKSLEKFLEISDDPSEVIESIGKKGSVNIKADIEEVVLDNTLYIDSENSSFFDELSVTSAGISVNGSAFYNKSSAGVKIESMLGKDYYGVKFDGNLFSKIKNSDLLKVVDSSGTVKSYIDSFSEALNGASFSTIKEENEQAISALISTLNELEPTVKSEKVEVSGKKIKAGCVSYDVDDDTMKKIADAYKTYEKDSQKTITEIMEKLTGSSYKDMYENIYETLDEELEDNTYKGTIKFYIADEMLVIAKADITETNKEDTAKKSNMAAALSFGADPSVGDEIALTVSVSEGEDSNNFDAKVKKVDNDSELSFTCEIKNQDESDDITTSSSAFTFNKTTNEYEFKLDDSDNITNFAIGGTFTHTDKSFNVTLDKVTINGDDSEISVKVSGSKDFKMPEMPSDVKDIFEMSEKELNEKFGLILALFVNTPSYDTDNYDFSNYNFGIPEAA